MRQIQQLVYDVERRHLFCPDHPSRDLEVGTGPGGAFTMICTAPVPGVVKDRVQNCMRSAEWPSRNDMIRDLQTSN